MTGSEGNAPFRALFHRRGSTPTGASAVRVDGLSKSYGPTQALDECLGRLRGGSVHTVLGENGSGKSTLIKALSGVVVPDAGGIVVDGEVACDGYQSQRGT